MVQCRRVRRQRGFRDIKLVDLNRKPGCLEFPTKVGLDRISVFAPLIMRNIRCPFCIHLIWLTMSVNSKIFPFSKSIVFQSTKGIYIFLGIFASSSFLGEEAFFFLAACWGPASSPRPFCCNRCRSFLLLSHCRWMLASFLGGRVIRPPGRKSQQLSKARCCLNLPFKI